MRGAPIGTLQGAARRTRLGSQAPVLLDDTLPTVPCFLASYFYSTWYFLI